ncbi:hypothetical protein JVU11DRAFT_2550 [Chiua virens]|nr:hypothetical protein JVU11DRAFT_2550 [Chiua virens]
MAGPKKPIIHDALHDLKFFLYVLVGICTLYDRPFKQKLKENLEQCYDKFFNTFKPSVFKTITIQFDLMWHLFIIDHIHPYFTSLIFLFIT